MSVRAVAWQEKLRAGRALCAAPAPLGSSVGSNAADVMRQALPVPLCVGEGAALRVAHHEVGQPRKQRASVDVAGRRGHQWKPHWREPGDEASCSLWHAACPRLASAAPCEERGAPVSSWHPGAGPARWLPEPPGPSQPARDVPRWPGRKGALPKPLPAAGC